MVLDLGSLADRQDIDPSFACKALMSAQADLSVETGESLWQYLLLWPIFY
jgi:hypothetical protein